MKKTDVLIIGSGIAGLSLAIKLNLLNPALKITIVTKSATDDCNTRYAQGGIAAVMNELNDSYESHIEDTLKCGKGFCDKRIVEMVVRRAPGRIRELMELGVQFDRDTQNNIEPGLEGGHSASRIVHYKDKTGFEIESVLIARVQEIKEIMLLQNRAVVDLMLSHTSGIKQCSGVYLYDQISNEISTLQAHITVLATGGCGQVYMNTTNPAVATGDGYAMAHRAGADIKNMRFMQFHPTSLYQGKNKSVSFLLSEALRGFGAHIVDAQHKRFLFLHDARGELATRDIVSEAIFKHLNETMSDCVYLDLRHLDAADCDTQFPQITQQLRRSGFDYKHELIPIVPSAHYQCGGITVNENAQSSIRNLYALGEVACTGLHGANRLASNSLLEALVFSSNAALTIADTMHSAMRSESIVSSKPKTVEQCKNNQIENLTCNIKEMLSSDAFQTNTSNQCEILKKMDPISQWVEHEILGNHYSIDLLNLRNLLQTAILITEDKLKFASKEKRHELQYSK